MSENINVDRSRPRCPTKLGQNVVNSRAVDNRTSTLITFRGIGGQPNWDLFHDRIKLIQTWSTFGVNIQQGTKFRGFHLFQSRFDLFRPSDIQTGENSHFFGVVSHEPTLDRFGSDSTGVLLSSDRWDSVIIDVVRILPCQRRPHIIYLLQKSKVKLQCQHFIVQFEAACTQLKNREYTRIVLPRRKISIDCALRCLRNPGNFKICKIAMRYSGKSCNIFDLWLRLERTRVRACSSICLSDSEGDFARSSSIRAIWSHVSASVSATWWVRSLRRRASFPNLESSIVRMIALIWAYSRHK